MNTDTVNPEAPTSEQADRRPEPSFGVDTTLVRIAFVVLTIVGGAGIPLYLAGLLLIPDEGSDQSIAGSIIESFQNRSR
jgi:hypothetical protein